MTRWEEGGWPTLEAAMEAYRMLLRRVADFGGLWLADWDTPHVAALDWLTKDAPWRGNIIGYTTEEDGRGNRRFVAVAKDGGHHPFSIHGALHNDWRPPKPPLDPNNPFEGLVS